MVASAISWRVAPLGSALQHLPEGERGALLACFALVRLAVERELAQPTPAGDFPPHRAAVCARLTLLRIGNAHPEQAASLNAELATLGEGAVAERLDAADGLVVRFQRLDRKAAAWLTTDEALSHWVLELATLDVALLLLLLAADTDEDGAKSAMRAEVETLLDGVERLLDQQTPAHHAALEIPTAQEFVTLAHAAFTERAELAHAIAELAGRWYPDDPAVAAARQLFAPVVVRRVPPGSDPVGRARNHEWLRVHERDYVGQWLVLSGGELLAHADQLEAAITRLGGVPPGALLVRAGT